MFADSFCDSAWENRSHRGWTTSASFALQALVVATLLTLPLLYNEVLPRLAFNEHVLAPAPLPLAPPMSSHPDPTVSSSNHLTGIVITSPSEIPLGVANVEDVPPPIDPGTLRLGGAIGDQSGRGNVPYGILGSPAVGPPPPLAPAARPPRPSVMMEGSLIHRVQPEYPALARQARIQGVVVLRAVISREGAIENLQVLSGHPMLAPAALEAVRQWRYRPYSLNGEPVEVETQITVNFVLGG